MQLEIWHARYGESTCGHLVVRAWLATLPKIAFQKKKRELKVTCLVELDFTMSWLGKMREGVTAEAERRKEISRAVALLRAKTMPGVDVESVIAAVERWASLSPKTTQALAKERRDDRARLDLKRSEAQPWANADIEPDEIHPNAKRLLSDPLFWDPTDDLGPVGNDTGADVLDGYKRWTALATGSRRAICRGPSASVAPRAGSP